MRGVNDDPYGVPNFSQKSQQKKKFSASSVAPGTNEQRQAHGNDLRCYVVPLMESRNHNLHFLILLFVSRQVGADVLWVAQVNCAGFVDEELLFYLWN